MTTAFVLSGGAILGSLQAGMLLAFAERDIEADLLLPRYEILEGGRMVRALRPWSTAVAVGALVALGLVACGGGGERGSVGGAGSAASAGAETPRTAEPRAPDTARPTSAIPDVTVLDVASGKEFALGTIIPSDRPVLVWFWAPH